MLFFYQSLATILLVIVLTDFLSGNVGTRLEEFLGFSPILMIWLSAIFSYLQLPVYVYKKEVTPPSELDIESQTRWLSAQENRTTIVYASVGGALIPVAIALYQLTRVSPLAILLTSVAVIDIVYKKAIKVANVGILLNIFLAPAIAATIAFLLAAFEAIIVKNFQIIQGISVETNLLYVIASQAIPIAFAGAILGVTIGADILHIRKFLFINTSEAISLGGGGLLDNISLSGMLTTAILYYLFNIVEAKGLSIDSIILL